MKQCAVLLPLALVTLCPAAEPTKPIASPELVFEEKNGIVAIEAEHFHEQTLTDKRAWYLTTKDLTPDIQPDGDPSHIGGASGGAYLEILPDTRRTHGDKLIKGENFTDEPGKMAILSYKVHFNTPGKYWLWARACSTTSEDNGLHFGINGTWPDSARKWQTVTRNQWHWKSAQRTGKVHVGVPGILTLDVPSTGEHTIQVSMREDGIALDKILLANTREYTPKELGPHPAVKSGTAPASFEFVNANPATKPKAPALQQPRQADGSGAIDISGELKQWHKVTLTLDGPFAHELDNSPNPFTDYDLRITFSHSSGGRSYTVPGYFAADGNAANSSAKSGTKWRAHFAPDQPGTWNYTISFLTAPLIINGATDAVGKVQPLHEKSGSFTITATDKKEPDFRARGRLAYVGKNLLQFQGDQSYFLKAGADAPETLLGYADFDDTRPLNPKKVPLKTFKDHVRDWQSGDPVWKDTKGKGLIGALNYLAGKGMNAFSFLPYNVDGDGSNVWPFVAPRDKYHYDCSKLDQWGIVFDHATNKGLYLHFKLQETEIDDMRSGESDKLGKVPASLDGGDLGTERRLYCRELVARFGHNLALNWNIGEENTQTTRQIKDMIEYIRSVDAYNHHVVLHTFPNQQDKQYRPLLGYQAMTGLSVQNSNVRDCHSQVVKWVSESNKASHPWVVAFDEPGDASFGMPPDPNWPGMPHKSKSPSVDDLRNFTLWGTLLARGGAVEYYFGYKLPENDLVAENWRSRDLSWDYARHALEFFRDQKIPVQDMTCRDELVGNPKHDNSKYCLAKDGEIYLVYLPDGGSTEIKIPAGNFSAEWFNPRNGQTSSAAPLKGNSITAPDTNDWLAVIRKN